MGLELILKRMAVTHSPVVNLQFIFRQEYICLCAPPKRLDCICYRSAFIYNGVVQMHKCHTLGIYCDCKLFSRNDSYCTSKYIDIISLTITFVTIHWVLNDKSSSGNYFIIICTDNVNFGTKIIISLKVCFSYSFIYSFLEMNKFMKSKIAGHVFRRKLGLSENTYTLIKLS